MQESIVFCSTCTMSSFAISSPDEFLVKINMIYLYMPIIFTVTSKVTSVRPLYGPVAGGTRVTITGQYLSTVKDVYFGQHQGVIDRQRSAVLLCLVCVVIAMLFGIFPPNFIY